MCSLEPSDKPLISVIMPVYNAERYVGEAIESILKQSYGNFELLIVDDGSYDRSYQIMQSFNDDRVVIFKNEKNLGYLKSVNFLFSKSQGEYIAFQDADDVSSFHRFSLQAESLLSDPKLMYCGTQCKYSKNGKELRRSSFPLAHEKVVQKLERGDTVVLCGASVMLKRQFLDDYHGYREFFDRIGAEHLDLFWRMLLTHKYKNLPEYLYNYRSESNSFTQKLDLNPLRYHSTQIALLAYWQCKQNGSDILGDKALSSKLVNNLEAKYKQDDSLIYTKAAITQLSFGNIRAYFWCLKESILKTKFAFSNVKLMIVWLPLFVFLHVSPKRFQRKIIEKNNLKFLKEMGVDVKAGNRECGNGS